jgi:8-oxo-dGTP diphosphatase
VKAVIINNEGLILIIKHAGDETHLENLWDVPGGRFEYGETPQEGLKREVKEESGLEIQIVEPIRTWTFMRDNGEQIFGTTFLCETEGLDVGLGDEHTEFRWVEAQVLDDFPMHDELREGLKRAYERWNKISAES